jgi:hypothetical protein
VGYKLATRVRLESHPDWTAANPEETP